jgi:hypothetical protein
LCTVLIEDAYEGGRRESPPKIQHAGRGKFIIQEDENGLYQARIVDA